MKTGILPGGRAIAELPDRPVIGRTEQHGVAVQLDSLVRVGVNMVQDILIRDVPIQERSDVLVGADE